MAFVTAALLLERLNGAPAWEGRPDAHPPTASVARPNRLVADLGRDPVRPGKGRCEHCGRPHGQSVFHLGDGRWWDEAARTWWSGQGRALTSLPAHAPLPEDSAVLITKVVLAAAHLDHDPGNNRQRTLKALCQRCHMLHHREEHHRRRWLTFRMRKALGDLVLGRYSVFS